MIQASIDCNHLCTCAVVVQREDATSEYGLMHSATLSAIDGSPSKAKLLRLPPGGTWPQFGTQMLFVRSFYDHCAETILAGGNFVCRGNEGSECLTMRWAAVLTAYPTRRRVLISCPCSFFTHRAVGRSAFGVFWRGGLCKLDSLSSTSRTWTHLHTSFSLTARSCRSHLPWSE